MNQDKQKILVTGAAGFIGSYLVKALAELGYEIVGLDNLNTYYDIDLKYGRLENLNGVYKDDIEEGKPCVSRRYGNYRFIRGDIVDRELLTGLFAEERFDKVCNLAAQAGVRYSIENPHVYAECNLVGFLNVLEACRNFRVSHLVYASSSSVYGQTDKVPFREGDRTDSPISLYAATKKSNELMAHVYSELYRLPTTGLRFFTVYGPWGRPDMAPYLFMRSIVEGEPIRVFNYGRMFRDFTYIGDVIKALTCILEESPDKFLGVLGKIYNVGHSSPVKLMDFIHCIETVTGYKAICRYEEMQPGDVLYTYADTTRLQKDYRYTPQTDLEKGIQYMYEWYRGFSLGV